MKVKVSKNGLQITENYNWYHFGLLVINRHELDNSILHVRYQSGSQHSKFPKKLQISQCLFNIITSLFDTGEINYELIKELSDEEKDLFTKLMTASKLNKELKYNVKLTVPNMTFYKTKYNVLNGEIQSGNDSKVIKDELIDVITKLVHFGLFTLDNANEMIAEIKQI